MTVAMVREGGALLEPLERTRSLVEGCIHSMRGDTAAAARALRLLVEALQAASGRTGPRFTDEAS